MNSEREVYGLVEKEQLSNKDNRGFKGQDEIGIRNGKTTHAYSNLTENEEKCKKYKLERKKRKLLANKLKLKFEKIEALKQAKLLREVNNQEGKCVRFRSRSSFSFPSSKCSVLKTNKRIGRSILKPNPYSRNYKECTYNHNHGKPMGIWSETSKLCKQIKKKEIPYFTDFPSCEFIKKKSSRRKNVQCALMKYQMPGCDCEACWEHRLKPGPAPCLPVPLCEREHVDSTPLTQPDRGQSTSRADPMSGPATRKSSAETLSHFVKSIGSRTIARLLGRDQPVDPTIHDALEPWQQYAAATAMSEAHRPATIEELEKFTTHGPPYGNPVAQLEHDQYEQNDVTVGEVPHTKTELASRSGRKTTKRKAGCSRAKNADDRFANDRVQQVETEHNNGNLSVVGQFFDAFRDKPSEYEVQLMAAEAADRELERREAVANGEIDAIDPTADECVIM